MTLLAVGLNLTRRGRMTSELKGFRDVAGGNGWGRPPGRPGCAPPEGRDRARGGETEAFHGLAQELRPAGIRRRDLSQDPGRKVRVEAHRRPAFAGRPAGGRASSTRAPPPRWTRPAAPSSLHSVTGATSTWMSIAVEQGPGDPRLIRAHRPRRAGAGGVSAEPAGARVHRGEELEARGKAQRAAAAGDGDRALLERLAQRLEDVAAELGELVEEEDAVVGEADLARPRDGSAADEGRVARRVVRGCGRAARRAALRSARPRPSGSPWSPPLPRA